MEVNVGRSTCDNEGLVASFNKPEGESKLWPRRRLLRVTKGVACWRTSIEKIHRCFQVMTRGSKGSRSSMVLSCMLPQGPLGNAMPTDERLYWMIQLSLVSEPFRPMQELAPLIIIICRLFFLSLGPRNIRLIVYSIQKSNNNRHLSRAPCIKSYWILIVEYAFLLVLGVAYPIVCLTTKFRHGISVCMS
jgi:hypothetical protein